MFFLSTLRRPPTSSLFPYTTLFRSATAAEDTASRPKRKLDVWYVPTPHEIVERMLVTAKVRAGDVVYDLGCGDGRMRSEEHTSELQSRLHLVCRLLLEKKKDENTTT